MDTDGHSTNIKLYFLNRIGLAVLTIFFLATIMFALFRLLPGDPTLTVLSPALAPEVQAELRERFGLDRPILEQYGRYLLSIVTLEFGVSFNRAIPVSQIMGPALANTVVLMLPSMVLAYVIRRGGRRHDRMEARLIRGLDHKHRSHRDAGGTDLLDLHHLYCRSFPFDSTSFRPDTCERPEARPTACWTPTCRGTSCITWHFRPW